MELLDTEHKTIVSHMKDFFEKPSEKKLQTSCEEI